jgi:hypothetical protein
MLCPILAAFGAGAIIVQRRVQMLTQDEFEELWNGGRYPDWDYMPGEEGSPLEPKASNWGWLDGRPVAVDYALPGS